jgi:hypothetical protein
MEIVLEIESMLQMQIERIKFDLSQSRRIPVVQRQKVM